ncbi:MAG: hypothetical protein PUB98_09550 [Clostridiales bacterium]|nr:hypothetical protein [Clostridiales bacterium]
MKKLLSALIAIITMASLCSCSKQELADLTPSVNDEYAAIVWEDRTYVPYCTISKSDCGQQIGIVGIINYYIMDSAM